MICVLCSVNWLLIKVKRKSRFRPPHTFCTDLFIISAERLGSCINFLSQNSYITHCLCFVFKGNNDIIYVEITYQLYTGLMS